MAKLPTYVDSGGISDGSGTFHQIRISDAIGHGLDSLSKGMTALAKASEGADMQAAGFRAQRSLIQYQEDEALARVKAQEDMAPDGKDYYTTYSKEAAQRRESFLSGLTDLPPKLRQQFEIKGLEVEKNATIAAAKDEYSARKKFAADTIQKTADGVAQPVLQGADPKAAYDAVDEFVGQMGFTEAQSNFISRSMKAQVDSARLQHLTSTDPTGTWRQLRPQIVGDYQGLHPLQSKMVEVSERYGLDPRLMLMVSSRENHGLNPNLKNPGSTAYGLFQFIDSDWKQYGIPKTGDPAMQVEAMARRLVTIRDKLQSMGLPLTPGAVYGSHLLGQAGYMTMITADPGADARSTYARAAGANIAGQAFSGINGKLLVAGQTVGQTLANIERYAEAGAGPVAGMLAKRASTTDPEAPLKVGDEEFLHITRNEANAIFAKSSSYAQKEADGIMRGLAKQRIDAGIVNGYDPADRRVVNDDWKKREMGDRILTGDADAHGEAMAFVRQYGFVPETASAAAQKMLSDTANKPAQVQGYELGREVHNADPLNGMENSGFKGDMKKRVEMYTALVNAGGKHAPGHEPTVEEKLEAVQRVEKIFSADKDQRFTSDEFRTKLADAKKDLTFTDVKKMLEMSEGPWYWRNDTSPQSEGIRAQIVGKFQEFFEYHMKQAPGTGSDHIEGAKAKAASDLKMMFGTSRVFGDSRAVMFPPEWTLPAVGGSHKWVADQAWAMIQMKTEADNRRGANLGQVNVKDIMIAGDPQTAHEWRAGKAPSYMLAWKNSKGELETLPTRFTPDPSMARQIYANRPQESSDAQSQQPPQQQMQPASIVPRTVQTQRVGGVADARLNRQERYSRFGGRNQPATEGTPAFDDNPNLGSQLDTSGQFPK